MVIFSKLRRGRFPKNVEKLVLDLAGVLPHVVHADGMVLSSGIAICAIFYAVRCRMLATWFSIISPPRVYHNTVQYCRPTSMRMAVMTTQ